VKGNEAATREGFKAIFITIAIFVICTFVFSSLMSGSTSRITDRVQQQTVQHARGKHHATTDSAVAQIGVTRTPLASNPNTDTVPRFLALKAGMVLGVFCVFAYWGFKATSGRGARVVFVGNPLMWIFVLLGRLAGAVIVGVAFTPRKLAISIRDIRVAARTRAQLQRGEI
jgi:hypothetical protein